MNLLEIKNINVLFEDKELLRDINLNVVKGARHLLHGDNGSGKTTLVQTIAGNFEYKVKSGNIIFDNQDITDTNTTTRALMGIFIGAQNVPEISGLTITSLLKHSMTAHYKFQTGKDLLISDFLTKMEDACKRLNIPKEWLNRSVNIGFSGGERKKLMFLRLLMINPKLAILDEPDSGTDIATQKLFAEIMHEMSETTFLFISHQEKFTQLVSPTAITSLSNGKIVIE
ncbi:MAG: ABC transporter ATP-binding protein [Alphaproteobacteria bacterium]|jgi:Fe-S cluster assembly ATP-binding protein|nr:ATP-binding cassette domain-containing protein [Alphaproteobacteria bacterium]